MVAVPDSQLVALATTLVLVTVLIGGFLVVRRRGYRFGPQTIVRCREGHLFTTVWIPYASFKAIRLGLVRIQYCPVGHHITFVTPVRDEDLTDLQRRVARMHHDSRVP